jgi:hypothetical protein
MAYRLKILRYLLRWKQGLDRPRPGPNNRNEAAHARPTTHFDRQTSPPPPRTGGRCPGPVPWAPHAGDTGTVGYPHS